MYAVAQFAKQVGVSVKTLQRWDREGSLKAKRTLSGRRYYDEADLATALNLPQRPALRRTVAYCRVSGPAQASVRDSPHGIGRDEHLDTLSRTRVSAGLDEYWPPL